MMNCTFKPNRCVV